jgi:hypothetical protein
MRMKVHKLSNAISSAVGLKTNDNFLQSLMHITAYGMNYHIRMESFFAENAVLFLNQLVHEFDRDCIRHTWVFKVHFAEPETQYIGQA